MNRGLMKGLALLFTIALISPNPKLSAWQKPRVPLVDRGPEKGFEFEEVDFEKIERKIAKEPEYVADPLYALFIFGPKAEAKVWCVLDKSKKDQKYFDVLYFDKNANGDLTEEGEKITAEYNKEMEKYGSAISLKIKEWEVPGVKDMKHTNLMFGTVNKEGRKGIWFSMNWRGEIPVMGGQGGTGIDNTIWAGKASDAPILRPTPLAPITFGFWGSKPQFAKPGQQGKIHNLILCSKGLGENAMICLPDGYIDLDKEKIWIKVIGKDKDGKEVEDKGMIDESC